MQQARFEQFFANPLNSIYVWTSVQEGEIVGYIFLSEHRNKDAKALLNGVDLKVTCEPESVPYAKGTDVGFVKRWFDEMSRLDKSLEDQDHLCEFEVAPMPLPSATQHGYLCRDTFTERFIFDSTSIDIEASAVDPKWHGKGIGTALAEICVQRAKRDDLPLYLDTVDGMLFPSKLVMNHSAFRLTDLDLFVHLFFMVFTGNKKDALMSWRKIGFQEISEMKGRPLEVKEDENIYVYLLKWSGWGDCVE